MSKLSRNTVVYNPSNLFMKHGVFTYETVWYDPSEGKGGGGYVTNRVAKWFFTEESAKNYKIYLDTILGAEYYLAEDSKVLID